MTHEDATVTVDDLLEVLQQVFGKRKYRRLSCFAHALHNVVKDGFKKAAAVPQLEKLLSEVARIVKKLHNSTISAEEFEKRFGKTISKKLVLSTSAVLDTFIEVSNFLHVDDHYMHCL